MPVFSTLIVRETGLLKLCTYIFNAHIVNITYKDCIILVGFPEHIFCF